MKKGAAMSNWIIPCNPKYYDAIGAFAKLPKVDWKQSTKNIAVGDIVYVYVGKPVMAILFKCKVSKINLPAVEIDDHEFIIDGTNYETYGNYMELELLEKYAADQITLNALTDCGMKGNIQSPRRTEVAVQGYINSVKGLQTGR